MKFFAVALGALFLVACGGGGGASGSSQGGAGGSASSNIGGLPRGLTASAIVDVNGDGRADLVVAPYADGSPTRYAAPIVLLNDGNGSSFSTKMAAMPATYLGIDGAVVDINAGDFNHDGKTDLLVITIDNRSATYYQSSQIQLYLGNGDGSFTDATSSNITRGNWPKDVSFASSTGWAEFLRVADFDGDGSLDFIPSSFTNNSGTIYRNDGSGRFAPAPISVTIGASVVNAMEPNALGVNQARDVLVGDMDGDGKPDILSLERGTFFKNTSTPANLSFERHDNALPLASGLLYQGALVDINNDGFPDILTYVSNDSNPVPLNAHINDTHGVFAPDYSVFLPSPPLVHGPRQALVGDLNGDGLQDVFFSNSGADFVPFAGAANLMLVNDGAGKLVDVTASRLDLMASYTHQSALGDFTGDGRPDLLLNNSDTKQARFWTNSAGGTFTATTPAIR